MIRLCGILHLSPVKAWFAPDHPTNLPQQMVCIRCEEVVVATNRYAILAALPETDHQALGAWVKVTKRNVRGL